MAAWRQVLEIKNFKASRKISKLFLYKSNSESESIDKICKCEKF